MGFVRKLLVLIASIISSIIFTGLLAEVWLRLRTPPQLKIIGSHIHLEKNTSYLNTYPTTSKKFPKNIFVRKNSLGFRGEEPPLNFSSFLSIITVGGSTTENIFSSEGETWSDKLASHLTRSFSNVWINNAGLDGHSIFGHTHLLQQYIAAIQPKVVIYLVGINDIAIDDPRKDEQAMLSGFIPSTTQKPFSFFDHSYVSSYIQYYFRKKGSHGLASYGDTEINFSVLGISTEAPNLPVTDLSSVQKRVHQYASRLQNLISQTWNAGITPVLVTQPAVYGPSIDPTTGQNLCTIDVADFTEGGVHRSGCAKWELLTMYNDTTKSVARQTNTMVVDLALEMPKDTKYFYDFIHFTTEGNDQVSKILYDSLCPYFHHLFPAYSQHDCSS